MSIKDYLLIIKNNNIRQDDFVKYFYTNGSHHLLPGGDFSFSNDGCAQKYVNPCYTDCFKKYKGLVNKESLTYFLGMCGITYDYLPDMTNQFFDAKIDFAIALAELIKV